LEPGMRVLDLMSSWVSHLPVSKNDISLTGLGMNRQELASNTLLNDYLIHDLNRSPALPFEDRVFDLVICTASVEYLSSPIGVFREIARVLKPGGRFVNTFSNRWFPPKAIQLWAQLHPFERMGLVLDFYRRAEAYDDLHTESVQGLPRPENDKYAGRIALSDPVFAVWARRAQA
ncbi:class I SAM-dependent methyltransferase, partial [Thiogranum longum]